MCSEITLPTGIDKEGRDRTAVCCLSSLNVEKYDEWKDDEKFVDDVMRFLDNVLSDFIKNAPEEFSDAVYSATKERSVGLGVMGLHSYFQKKMIPLESYMIVSSAVFCLGLYNVMTRRNAVAILMGIELILNAANINFIAFNRFNGLPILDGHIMSVFVIVLAAAEAAVALAIIINLYRNIGSVDVDDARTLKG